MLQPALTTSVLNTPVLVARAPATYGTLIRSAREALDVALALSNGRPLAGEAVVQELLGYERFLYGAGGHLRQLAGLADLHTDALRRLTSRLDRSTQPHVEDSTWFRAARVINAAHDLVATHLIDGSPRTVEAEEIVLGPASAAVSREVVTMILDAVEGSRQLIHRAARAQQRGHGSSLVPARMFAHLQETNHVISLCARATMYDLAHLPAGTGDQLDHLQPALPTHLAVAPVSIHGPLSAIRVLRQLCHEQARGLTAASPASLRDLALLGTRALNVEALPATDDDRPLTRLQRAHAEDQIDTARSAWAVAATELTTVVQGLTKAPGAYGTAVRALLDDPLDQRTQIALLTALPALGQNAARTVQTLARRGGLVTRQPVPLQPRTAWRPISDEHAAAVTEQFGTAALRSSLALDAVRDLQRMATSHQPAVRREQSRQRHLSQSLEQREAAR